jgi:hypothetical protein
MALSMRVSVTSAKCLVVLTLVLLSSGSAWADKLKGFYVGSGGITQEVSRVVLIEFATDTTAIVQQNWQGKDPQTWHAHWTQDGNKVTVTFDAVKDKAAMEPLVMEFKRGTLTPTPWDAVLGMLGPPKLTPFSGKNVQTNSVASCRDISTVNGGKCVQWDSRSGK